MSTIYIDLTPSVLSIEYPSLYADLVRDGYYGDQGPPGCWSSPCQELIMAITTDWARFGGNYPAGTTFEAGYGPAAVPEPATAVLLSFALLLVMLPRKLRWR